MKKGNLKLVSFLLLSLGVYPSPAQPYESLFSHGSSPTSWTHVAYNLGTADIVHSLFQKDTLVHGKVYKKVILQNPPSDFPGGLFREDTVTGLVWYRDIVPYHDPRDTLERLAFRFDLQVGDTVDLGIAGVYPPPIGVVDSVRTIMGRKHIYFNQLTGNEPITFIEGIGSNQGIFWKANSYSIQSHIQLLFPYLLCSYKNGGKTFYYNIRYEGDCQPDLKVERPGDPYSAPALVNLYPQPASSRVNIDHSGKPITLVQLFTAQGKLVRQIKGEDIRQWDVRDLPSGLYYLQLFSTEGYLTGQRMIVR